MFSLQCLIDDQMIILIRQFQGWISECRFHRLKVSWFSYTICCIWWRQYDMIMKTLIVTFRNIKLFIQHYTLFNWMFLMPHHYLEGVLLIFKLVNLGSRINIIPKSNSQAQTCYGLPVVTIINTGKVEPQDRWSFELFVYDNRTSTWLIHRLKRAHSWPCCEQLVYSFFKL